MGHFEKVYARSGRNEGGYSNVSGDRGGVTYAGITYSNYPNWKGWTVVFATERKHNEVIPGLAAAVKEFYRVEFWGKIGADRVQDEEFAYDLFDMAINASVGASVKLAQRTVGMKETGVISDELFNHINGIA